MKNYVSVGGKFEKKDSDKADIEKAIREYHLALNKGEWKKCLEMTCPDTVQKLDVTPGDFSGSLLTCMAAHSEFKVDKFLITLVKGKNHAMYKNRDYAQVAFERTDVHGKIQRVREVWVQHGDNWKCVTVTFPVPRRQR